MRVKETKSGKYKITGLTATHLAIIKAVFDHCDDAIVIKSLLPDLGIPTCIGIGVLTTEAYIKKFLDSLFGLLDTTLNGDV